MVNLLIFEFFLTLVTVSITQNVSTSQNSSLSSSFAYKDRLRSGAVFLLDERNILVSQFSYKNLALKNLGSRHNKWFKGIARSSNELIDLEYENGQNAQIQGAYLGKNIYLKVPSTCSTTIKDFSGIAIVNERSESKTIVEISPSDVENLAPAVATPLMNGDRFIFRYPKCCPFGEFSSIGEHEFNCVPFQDNATFSSHFPIHEINGDLYDTNEFKYVLYEPFYVSPENCEMITFNRDDNVTLLADLQFAVPQHPESKLSCMDYVQSSDSSNYLEEVVFACIDDMSLNSSGRNRLSSVVVVISLFIVFVKYVIL